MSAMRRERAGGPVAATGDFVGRGPQLDKITTLLLGSARVITLIGSGGIGKTRLATETLGRFHKTSGTPVYWVRLARLAAGCDIAAIESEIARSVVDADRSARSGWEGLVDTLTRTDSDGRALQTVLVMDNCEHVLDGAGRLITELLEAVPGLTVVATSREPIGWVDEHVVALPPLTQQQALALFRQRAVLTDHLITDTDDVAMADLICRHVHNHPLYIRLAAARLLRQPLAMILQELSGAATDRRMQWSHGPRVGAEPRHQGVRDAIAWSYDLCQDKERLLLERMSVFAAGYDTNPEDDTSSALDVGAELAAIEVVCADDPAVGHDRGDRNPAVSVATEEIEDLLERLADQSLVTRHITATEVRYSLLESIRVFAQQRLKERCTGALDEPARLARRHRRYYRDRVVQLQLNWFGPADQNWAHAAWDNIMTAIETSLTSGEPALGLEIAAGLIVFPLRKDSPREIRRWTERTLQVIRDWTPQPTELHISAMTLLGWLSMLQGRAADIDRMLDKCVAACIGDPNTRQNWRQSPNADIGLPAPVEFLWGATLGFTHRDSSALAVLARAREKFRLLGEPGSEARSELYEALCAGMLGSTQQALEITRRHLDHASASGWWAKAWAEMARAIALTKHGDPAQALSLGRTTLAHQVAALDVLGAAMAVNIRTWALAQIIIDSTAAGSTTPGRLDAMAIEIAQLAGGVTTLRAGLSLDLDDIAVLAAENHKAIDVARRVLRPGAFATAYQQGCSLRRDLHEVQSLALGTLSIGAMPLERPVTTATTSHWDELSAAEQQVATLAAAGWTNTAIAAYRGNSSKTVDAQMARIFHKLIITSREDIIGCVPEGQLGAVRREATRQPDRDRRRPHGPRSR
ncbi:LuxR C-terminal-related transcriptional regulator [Nocardia sp. NPDC049190]|uniref:ATP-binding protein n=1 Tax=Nocardia sp. NPDC049190 TaxID=3155650 RepID=UPI0033EE5569